MNDRARIERMMDNLGFQIVETEGGCTAWFRTQPIVGEERPCFVYVTDDGGLGIPSAWDEKVMVGLYKDDGRLIALLEYFSIVGIPDNSEYQAIYDSVLNPTMEGEDD